MKYLPKNCEKYTNAIGGVTVQSEKNLQNLATEKQNLAL